MGKKKYDVSVLTAKQLLEKLIQLEKEGNDLNHPIIIKAFQSYNLKPDIKIEKNWEINRKTNEIEYGGNLTYNIQVADHWPK